MKNVLVLTALISSVGALTGCATDNPYGTASPKQIGDDMYMSTMESSGFAVSGKKADLYRQANAHCGSMGKKMERVSDAQNKGGMFLDYTVELQYKCAAK